MNIVVLISGNGSNLQAIIDACKTNKIKGTVRAVFSNKADAFGLERARQAGIATHTLIASAFDSREAYDRELIHEIDMYAPDVVVLAGFMRILSPAFVSHYAGRLLNIHPSLLPKYPGLHTHRQALENGEEPSKALNPDECVALGASIQGGKLSGEAGAGDILLLDVTPLSLSIETMGGIATRLIERNTTIPTKKSQIFSTAADNQTAVDINVLQGERQFAKDNKSLGQFRLDGIPPARRGVPQFEVTFDIDANGIVNVSAKDLGTGKEQHITITAGSNMSESDIDKAVKEAAEFEAQDKKRKEAIDTKNNADSMVFQVENALKEAGDKLDANDKASVESDLNALKDILAKYANTDEIGDAQVAEIKAAQEKMMESAQKLFAKMYEAQNPQGGAGQAGPGPDMGGASQGGNEAGYGDDVVDADYKEV